MRPADTSPEAWKVYLDLHRRMSVSEKFRQALEWSEVIRRFAEAGMRQRHPGATDREIFLRTALINLGPDLFRKVHGEPPDGWRSGRRA